MCCDLKKGQTIFSPRFTMAVAPTKTMPTWKCGYPLQNVKISNKKENKK